MASSSLPASVFSRSAAPCAVTPCPIGPCAAQRGDDDKLSVVAQQRVESLTGRREPATGLVAGDNGPSLIPSDASACAKRAMLLGPTLRRFNRYREALPYARAANATNQLGNKPSSREPAQAGDCLTRLPETGAALSQALGLPPGKITDRMLRDDSTGFRAAVYRDDATGKLILVARDTQPKSLMDWLTNTRNGQGLDTDQYQAMRKLSGVMVDERIDFDVAGYSKGGGMAQQAALVNPQARAFVFNSSGLHENSLARTGTQDFGSLASRTQAFSSSNDFLTYMNTTADPAQQIANAQFLRLELEGKNRWAPNPMQIDHRSPQFPDGDDDPAFTEARSAYFGELDAMIARMQQDRAAGLPLRSFPPVRAGQQEVVPDSDTLMGNLLGASSPGPSLGKLYQHQMPKVLDPMEKRVERDREALEDFLERCP